MLDKKTVLVTGGTGSFGKSFIKRILKEHNVSKVIVYSRDELKQFEMQTSETFKIFTKEDKIRYFIGDVRDFDRLKMAMDGVDYVVHAAALKQVPAAEYNPFEAVKTNVIGGQNVIDAAMENNVEKVIALSTDKAAAPINLYGATKLTSDKLFVAANNYKGEKNIKFSVVRYGNVLGSRGSVIPFFIEQKSKGEIPITDERMTRFSITLEQGVDFVLFCLKNMWGGEFFVPKIPSYNILDIAKAIAPNVKLKIVGIRPGEKLHEEMITQTDSLNSVEFEKYYVILPSTPLWDLDEFLFHKKEDIGSMCENGFSYDSGSNFDFLSVDDLKNMIKNI